MSDAPQFSIWEKVGSALAAAATLFLGLPRLAKRLGGLRGRVEFGDGQKEAGMSVVESKLMASIERFEGRLTSVLERVASKLERIDEKLDDERVVHAEAKSQLEALRAGQERTETATRKLTDKLMAGGVIYRTGEYKVPAGLRLQDDDETEPGR